MTQHTDEAPFFAPLCRTPAIDRLVDLALDEDLGRGDPTSWVVAEQGHGVGRVVCREPVVACGLGIGPWILPRVDPDLGYRILVNEGAMIEAGTTLAEVTGPVDGILRAERTLLNFLMRMCGIATLTRRYAEQVAGTAARVADTRKTMPGWRVLDKYAVQLGGGVNHRFDLGSGVLLKDNHLAACGSVAVAVQRAKKRAPHPLRIEVEVESLADAQEALAAGAEILLLDNMTPDQVRHVRQTLGHAVILEVSGGITLETIRAYAEAGAEIISVGALTHSVPAVDLSMDFGDPTR